MSQLPYRLEAATYLELPASEEAIWFRAQGYARPGETPSPRLPHNFNINVSRNRYTPEDGKHGTCYYGLNDYLTALIEYYPAFREASVDTSLQNSKYRPDPAHASTAGPLVITVEELRSVELIQLKMNQDIKLIDLVSAGAYQRHPLEPSDILGRDLEKPNSFAQAVLDCTDADGIYYETRLGSKHSIAVFERAQDKVIDHEVVSRQSFYDFLYPAHIPAVEAALNIKIKDI